MLLYQRNDYALPRELWNLPKRTAMKKTVVIPLILPDNPPAVGYSPLPVEYTK